jgi:hypothetical protein
MTQSFVRHNPLKRPPHLPNSLDTSPSDFYLFGKTKNVLIEQEIPDKIHLLEVSLRF